MLYLVPCSGCLENVEKKRPLQKTFCKDCYRLRYNERNRIKWNLKPKREYLCGICGEKNIARQGGGKYCRGCRAEAIRRNSKKYEEKVKLRFKLYYEKHTSNIDYSPYFSIS